MLSQARLGLEQEAIDKYIRATVDIIVQLQNFRGQRFVKEIYYQEAQ